MTRSGAGSKPTGPDLGAALAGLFGVSRAVVQRVLELSVVAGSAPGPRVRTCSVGQSRPGRSADRTAPRGIAPTRQPFVLIRRVALSAPRPFEVSLAS